MASADDRYYRELGRRRVALAGVRGQPPTNRLGSDSSPRPFAFKAAYSKLLFSLRAHGEPADWPEVWVSAYFRLPGALVFVMARPIS
jgi:hypothetical protein